MFVRAYTRTSRQRDFMDLSPACRRTRSSWPLVRGALTSLALALLVFIPMAAHAKELSQLCQDVGTDDTLRPLPASLGAAVNAVFGMNMPPAQAARTTSYRCVRGRVLVCTTGANLPCGKANVSRKLPGADAYCRANPNADVIPATGHDTIFDWRCSGRTATVAKQTAQVDDRGFIKEYWKPLR